MSQSTTTPIKQAKAPAASGQKDPVHMIEKLETKTKAVYVSIMTSVQKRPHMEEETIAHSS